MKIVRDFGFEMTKVWLVKVPPPQMKIVRDFRYQVTKVWLTKYPPPPNNSKITDLDRLENVRKSNPHKIADLDRLKKVRKSSPLQPPKKIKNSRFGQIGQS